MVDLVHRVELACRPLSATVLIAVTVTAPFARRDCSTTQAPVWHSPGPAQFHQLRTVSHSPRRIGNMRSLGVRFLAVQVAPVVSSNTAVPPNAGPAMFRGAASFWTRSWCDRGESAPRMRREHLVIDFWPRVLLRQVPRFERDEAERLGVWAR
jgi:hypothetical protein